MQLQTTGFDARITLGMYVKFRIYSYKCKLKGTVFNNKFTLRMYVKCRRYRQLPELLLNNWI